VKWKGLNSKREFPIIKNWTSKMLKEREDEEIKHEGFGRGYPLERPKWDLGSKVQEGATDEKEDERDVFQTEDDIKDFMEDYLKKVEDMAKSIRSVLMKRKQIPGQLSRSTVLNTVNTQCEIFLNVKLSSNIQTEVDVGDDERIQDATFWDMAVKCMEEVEKIVKEQEEHVGNMYVPNFSQFVAEVEKSHGDASTTANWSAINMDEDIPTFSLGISPIRRPVSAPCKILNHCV